jgi:oxalate decarboxylase/phosphoglucose isomerase-like protein (cupin superfamily)
MNGVIIRKAKIVSDDERRTITEIMNGELSIKNLKILHVKKGVQLLGNHSHFYPEVMYIIKGSAKYRMKNIDTGEQEDFNLETGDVVFRTGRIVHAGWFDEDSIIIDGACEKYISADFNDIKEVILE